MGLSKELQNKLELYEQLYYGLDEPVPFKGDLKIYPVSVKDYYNFYGCLPCLTMDKTTKEVLDEKTGKIIKVADVNGIRQNYMTYLINKMKDEEKGQQLTLQVMQLFELVFHIKKGIYCSGCGKMIEYSELYQGMDEYVKQKKEEMINVIKNQSKNIDDNVKYNNNEYQIPNTDSYFTEYVDNNYVNNQNQHEVIITKEIENTLTQMASVAFLQEKMICSECKTQMRDVFSIKEENGISKFVIKNIEINANEFDEFKAIVPRQNIIDYDGDIYMDPDLKEELEIKARLKNSDYTSPTLEKQLVCIVAATGMTFDYLHTITLRKLSMLLRTVDKMNTYYSQLQGVMSGMVTFKEDPKHWIFSDDKKNIKDELTSLETFEKKFERVT